ncbi:chromosomal replication initiator protein DnaA [Candidatus Spongiihabitans sp.]|uniref:chromosomal replication initiator protein DnaA n=1 Tax=Candidatus Spongiihabitans sp. TaxID=3101308 RepID=UPI003C6FE502
MWDTCLQKLRTELSSDDINTWIMPLHPNFSGNMLNLLAPNRYVLNYVKQNLFSQIETTILAMDIGIDAVRFEIGSYHQEHADALCGRSSTTSGLSLSQENELGASLPYSGGVLNTDYTFAAHVEGKSNQLARAAALQVGKSPGKAFNPLFIYGGVGLGKTHLMQAAGQLMLDGGTGAKVIYIHSELFVNDMVKALKNNTMNEFKRYYRSLDALLIDDIQFFAKKTQSQEEFFHTFNSLLEGQRQIIITSDRIPKAINHVEERLISRFGSGLTVSIDPPELETRVAILEKKALERGADLPNNVAFFVANTVHSNVRELEGALHRILANSSFTERPIDMDLAREALRDILLYQETQISIENIQQTVAAYYKIRVADLLSKNRARAVARPRQIAMSFAKQFTNMSLPQIGDRFGGRDHTTVLHACRKIEELVQSDSRMKEDQKNLRRLFDG